MRWDNNGNVFRYATVGRFRWNSERGFQTKFERRIFRYGRSNGTDRLKNPNRLRRKRGKTMIDEVIKQIEVQQAGKENTAPYYVGEQLKDIIRKRKG